MLDHDGPGGRVLRDVPGVAPVRARHVDVCAVVHQHLHRGRVRALRRQHDERHAFLVAHVRRRVHVLHHVHHDLPRVALGGNDDGHALQHQGLDGQRLARVWCECRDDVEPIVIAQATRHMQRRFLRLRHESGVCTVLDERLHRGELPLLHRQHQRGVPLRARLAVGVRALFNELPHYLPHPTVCCLHDRKRAPRKAPVAATAATAAAVFDFHVHGEQLVEQVPLLLLCRVAKTRPGRRRKGQGGGAIAIG